MPELPAWANILLALLIVVALTWSVGAAALKAAERLPPGRR